jgi:hypothetical protein
MAILGGHDSSHGGRSFRPFKNCSNDDTATFVLPELCNFSHLVGAWSILVEKACGESKQVEAVEQGGNCRGGQDAAGCQNLLYSHQVLRQAAICEQAIGAKAA